MRVLGLDDSASPEEVSAAVARAGGCSVQAVSCGKVQRDPRGLGTAWIRCPVAAAKKVAEAGRLLVGWVSARVKVAEPKPIRCYKCLCTGHTRAKCISEVDRSDVCFRCGQLGHKAAMCSAKPNCVICAAAKKTAGHKLGGPACANPKLKLTTKPSSTINGRGRDEPSGVEEVAMVVA
ncbi:uncharacterized protein LOC142984736 [Anticarsia gemmatalis]|uniref:uncharacterized protein LOC142984736 n=1 Tax=Anticarsia gemmatalis TaxID=129554 RepID=UPI003F757FFC